MCNRNERILARVLTLLWIDFNMPRWEVMFSLVAMAILEKNKKNTFTCVKHEVTESSLHLL